LNRKLHRGANDEVAVGEPIGGLIAVGVDTADYAGNRARVPGKLISISGITKNNIAINTFALCQETMQIIVSTSILIVLCIPE